MLRNVCGFTISEGDIFVIILFLNCDLLYTHSTGPLQHEFTRGLALLTKYTLHTSSARLWIYCT